MHVCMYVFVRLCMYACVYVMCAVDLCMYVMRVYSYACLRCMYVCNA